MFGVSVMAVLLMVIFVLGVLAIVVGLVVAVTRRLRDHRTPEERRADEYGDLPPGSFKITPGMGSNAGGMGTGGMG